MNQGQNLTTAKCYFGDQRLTQRAVLIEEKLSVKYGKPLSSVFSVASELKRAYEFFANKKTSFNGFCPSTQGFRYSPR
ncbi:MAG: transposase DNA-binding-containing protein [Xenococcaceae cyanobacterium]